MSRSRTLWVGVFGRLFWEGKYQPGTSLGDSLTSQVSQRPQQASVVTLRPRQPGFLARKVNSLTAQPTNVRSSKAEALVAAPRPHSSRTGRAPRSRLCSFMLKQEGQEGRVGRASTAQQARSASGRAQLKRAFRHSLLSCLQTQSYPSSLSLREEGQVEE